MDREHKEMIWVCLLAAAAFGLLMVGVWFVETRPKAAGSHWYNPEYYPEQNQ